MSLPESYASPQHLPFNRSCLDRQFLLEAPDRDNGETGFWILLQGQQLIVVGQGTASVLPQGDTPPLQVEGAPLYLGLWQDRPCRVGRVSLDVVPGDDMRAVDLLAGSPDLPIDLLSLGGLARQVLHWEGNSRFCSRCGAAQQRLADEWGKRCPDCGSLHYPHIHPCVIVIVRRPGEILMTRKAEWPQGRYSLVAGFVDFSESLEDAVAREVEEETGILVKNVRYVGSQGWPFPSQLMAGFVADYAGGEVKVEEKELEDAGWFPVDDLPLLPPRRSISRYLIDNHARAEGGDA